MTQLSQDITSNAIEPQIFRRPKSALPTFSAMSSAPLMANGLYIAMLLLAKHAMLAVAVAGGCGVGLAIYAALYLFAERFFSMLFTREGGATTVAPTSLALFGALAGGKFVLIGAIMYLLIAVMHLNIAEFVVGFLVTQVCISVSVVRKLDKTKVID